ncbi:MAG TPA: hypothetical protein VEQ63_05620, partial [Bryobacteraceae bacterium]|nr:hypothetical protein [Bryobacteraceae bacterium]
MTDDIRKLLGGFSTGTLTDAEKNTLFTAALDDPALFEALADEQALKELLDDPSARAQVLQAAEVQRFSAWELLSVWFERPKSKALVATGAVLCLAIAVTFIRDHYAVRNSAVAPQPIEGELVARRSHPSSAQSNPFEIRRPTQAPRQPARSKPEPSAAAPQDGAQQPQARSSPTLADPPAALPASLPAEVAEMREQAAAVAAPRLSRLATSGIAQQGRMERPSGSSQFNYKLQRRTEDGSFQPVDSSTALEVSEEARLTLTFQQSGVVTLALDSKGTLAQYTVTAGQPLTVPVPGAVRTVRVAFNSSALLRNSLAPGSVAVEQQTAASYDSAAGQPVSFATEIKISR